MLCTNPVQIKSPTGTGFMTVPCGKCMACRIQKTREWTVRLLHELNSWSDAVFVTLTYSDEFVPKTSCGRLFLHKSDLQNFFKKVRKRLEGKKIKYFACGEYGSLGRPHFHSIIFGLSPKDLGLFQECWDKGFVKVGSVTADSCQYVTGYVRKKLSGDLLQEKYGCPVCSGFPPFQLTSQGLGKEFAIDNDLQILESGITVKGKRCSIPRYYGKKDDLIGTKFLHSSAYNILSQRMESSLQARDDELGKVARYKALLISESDKQREQTLKAKNNLFKGKL